MSNSGSTARPGRKEHFLNRAKVAAERSTCIRRKVGAVIIKDGVEISSGYVGAPRGMAHCIDSGTCLRRELKIASGTRYELCRSVHAEQNAIINAARTGVNITDSEMFIYSCRNLEAYGGPVHANSVYGPCIICKKELINAGIQRVNMLEEGVGEQFYTLEELKKELQEEEARLRSSNTDLPV